jgi:hypothetical protein
MRQAIEQLLGIVEAMVADGHLHDLEIEFLKVWLAEHTEVARVWPGHAVSGAIETVLADGHVSEDERAYLMTTLKQLASGEFAFDDREGVAEFALPLDNASSSMERRQPASDFWNAPAGGRQQSSAGTSATSSSGPRFRRTGRKHLLGRRSRTRWRCNRQATPSRSSRSDAGSNALQEERRPDWSLAAYALRSKGHC